MFDSMMSQSHSTDTSTTATLNTGSPDLTTEPDIPASVASQTVYCSDRDDPSTPSAASVVMRGERGPGLETVSEIDAVDGVASSSTYSLSSSSSLVSDLSRRSAVSVSLSSSSSISEASSTSSAAAVFSASSSGAAGTYCFLKRRLLGHHHLHHLQQQQQQRRPLSISSTSSSMSSSSSSCSSSCRASSLPRGLVWDAVTPVSDEDSVVVGGGSTTSSHGFHSTIAKTDLSDSGISWCDGGAGGVSGGGREYYSSSSSSTVAAGVAGTPATTAAETAPAATDDTTGPQQDHYCRLVVHELLATELAYVRDLQQVLEGYQFYWRENPEPAITDEHLAILFDQLHEIVRCNRLFLRSLQDAIGDMARDLSQVASCFISHAQHFSVYIDYCTSYPRTMSVLTELMRRDDTARLLRDRQVKLGHALPLGSFLLKPVQRILKYRLLLQSMLSRSEEAGGERVGGAAHSHVQWRGVMCTALSTMCRLAEHINEMKRRHEHAVRVHEIQSLLYDWPGNDLTTYGELVAEGSFRVPRVKTWRHVFLFNQMLLVTKRRTDRTLVYKTHIMCSNLMLIESVSGEPCTFHVVPFDNPKHQVTLQARSVEHKRDWSMQLKRVILQSYSADIPGHARDLVMQLGQPGDTVGSVSRKRSSRPLPHSAPEYLQRRRDSMRSCLLHRPLHSPTSVDINHTEDVDRQHCPTDEHTHTPLRNTSLTGFTDGRKGVRRSLMMLRRHSEPFFTRLSGAVTSSRTDIHSSTKLGHTAQPCSVTSQVDTAALWTAVPDTTIVESSDERAVDVHQPPDSSKDLTALSVQSVGDTEYVSFSDYHGSQPVCEAARGTRRSRGALTGRMHCSKSEQLLGHLVAGWRRRSIRRATAGSAASPAERSQQIQAASTCCPPTVSEECEEASCASVTTSPVTAHITRAPTDTTQSACIATEFYEPCDRVYAGKVTTASLGQLVHSFKCRLSTRRSVAQLDKHVTGGGSARLGARRRSLATLISCSADSTPDGVVGVAAGFSHGHAESVCVGGVGDDDDDSTEADSGASLSSGCYEQEMGDVLENMTDHCEHHFQSAGDMHATDTGIDEGSDSAADAVAVDEPPAVSCVNEDDANEPRVEGGSLPAQKDRSLTNRPSLVGDSVKHRVETYKGRYGGVVRPSLPDIPISRGWVGRVVGRLQAEESATVNAL